MEDPSLENLLGEGATRKNVKLLESHVTTKTHKAAQAWDYMNWHM